jgi:hypothetical protein
VISNLIDWILARSRYGLDNEFMRSRAIEMSRFSIESQVTHTTEPSLQLVANPLRVPSRTSSSSQTSCLSCAARFGGASHTSLQPHFVFFLKLSEMPRSQAREVEGASQRAGSYHTRPSLGMYKEKWRSTSPVHHTKDFNGWRSLPRGFGSLRLSGLAGSWVRS